MHQLAAYLKEREGFDCIVSDNAFASYKVQGEECYIRDIWVHKDYREAGIATTIAKKIEMIARGLGCKFLTGSVAIGCGDPTASTKVLLSYGFKVHEIMPSGIIFRKEI